MAEVQSLLQGSELTFLLFALPQRFKVQRLYSFLIDLGWYIDTKNLSLAADVGDYECQFFGVSIAFNDAF